MKLTFSSFSRSTDWSLNVRKPRVARRGHSYGQVGLSPILRIDLSWIVAGQPCDLATGAIWLLPLGWL